MMRKKAAIWYQRRGKPVFPTCPDKKIPLVSWKKYQKRITAPEEIAAFWDRWPDANISMATGEVSGEIVIDCDTPEAVKKIESYFPDGFLTPICHTPKGGRHYHFAFTPGLKNWVGIFPGVDIRTDGGQVLLPPSTKGDKQYRWLEGLAIHQVPLSPMPPKLLEDIFKEAKKEEPVYSEIKTHPGAYGAAALARELAAVSMAIKGCRNSTLNRAAFSLSQLVSGGELDAAQVETALHAAAVSIGLPTAEAAATIQSGFAAGTARPRSVEHNEFKIPEKYRKRRYR